MDFSQDFDKVPHGKVVQKAKVLATGPKIGLVDEMVFQTICNQSCMAGTRVETIVVVIYIYYLAGNENAGELISII